MMKISCNGCRILRKGCNDDCVIRPCLQWINSPESQANATLFLAKFYGRTGLLNLITAAPKNLAPAVFRSLLYEACGRIVNPAYGSMGLFWTGQWARCEAAVRAVLMGSKPNDEVAPFHSPSWGSCDIRHVPRLNTGLVDVRDRTGKIFKPQPRVALLESDVLSQIQPNRATKETEINLELSLGFH
ncbi:hypothetical protein HN51_056707 [Arachis hypogaea]|uniref:LOB domain-containing protein n=2 Tax=Arachis hypogaea TaxID=3818 RepID=A0A6B9VEV7_ARAHY|nr:LOB domain-containing protein 40-like [Arachis ipaensis]XP_025674349.1 LOB domain-containing protein 40 [Arachis hypogaea]QHN79637.1 LOB domain-containing protein [Arachis hypogaea]